MTLVVIRLRVADVRELEARYTERRALKEGYGCTASRLLLSRSDAQSALVLMDFRSFKQGQDYCTTSSSFLSPDAIASMTNLGLEYFEDVRPADAAAATSSERLVG